MELTFWLWIRNNRLIVQPIFLYIGGEYCTVYWLCWETLFLLTCRLLICIVCHPQACWPIPMPTCFHQNATAGVHLKVNLWFLMTKFWKNCFVNMRESHFCMSTLTAPRLQVHLRVKNISEKFDLCQVPMTMRFSTWMESDVWFFVPLVC